MRKKNVIIGLFLSLCFLSVFLVPRIVYGVKATISGKQVDTHFSESERITFEEAKSRDPFWAVDQTREYSSYTKNRRTWYANSFWLTHKDIEIEKGTSSEAQDTE